MILSYDFVKRGPLLCRLGSVFDLDGGIWSEADQEKMRAGTAAGADSLEVTFGENYGVLPVPVKEGAVFDGWRYSGQNITEDTKVTVNGEHVLTAQWK